MSVKLYVGNLSYQCSDENLAEAFASFGEVVSARIITDRMSGRSKGFGFVEMSDSSSAHKAIESMNGREFMGRNINVSEAKPQERRPQGSWGGAGGRRQGGSHRGSSRY